MLVKKLAIILDNKIISAPVINEAILGGNGQITGNFTFQEATDLAYFSDQDLCPLH